MIDISDGLSSELLHICTNSGVGGAIYEDKIPIDTLTYNTAEEFNLDATVCALSGGEDYELLFTVPLAAFDKMKNWSAVSIIGKITEKTEGINLVTKSESTIPITAQGWDTFLKKN